MNPSARADRGGLGALVAAAFWVVLVGISFASFMLVADAEVEKLARAEARGAFLKDILSKRRPGAAG